MAEWSNAHDSKSCDAGMYPWVQIPLSAPRKKEGFCLPFFVCKNLNNKNNEKVLYFLERYAIIIT